MKLRPLPVFSAGVVLWALCVTIALWSFGAAAQSPQTVGTTLYIKSATYALTQKVKDPKTGKTSTVTISRHSTAELAQRAAWKLKPGSYQITTPTYFLEVKPCPDYARVGYCTDWVDSRISVVQATTTNRVMFVTPLPPGTPLP